MRFVLTILVGASVTTGCGKKCKEYDPGPGCDLVFTCCNEEETDCEWEARDEKVFTCAGGAGNCRDATEEMLCYVCNDAFREAAQCKTPQMAGIDKDKPEEVEYISCADGTETACTECQRGCCDGHGGCAH